ncbi:hypothetical protein AgCh_011794 [Apium graveolens]
MFNRNCNQIVIIWAFELDCAEARKQEVFSSVFQPNGPHIFKLIEQYSWNQQTAEQGVRKQPMQMQGSGPNGGVFGNGSGGGGGVAGGSGGVHIQACKG